MKMTLLYFVCLMVFVTAVPAQQTARERAIELYKQGKFDESINLLETYFKNKVLQTDAEAWTFLGLSYFNLMDYKNARKSLEAAVKYQPQNATFQGNLAYFYLYTAQMGKAQRAAKEALRIDPRNVDASYVLGAGELWQGDLDEASKIADNILAIDIGFPKAYLLKSDVLMATLGKRVSGGSAIRDELDLLRQNVEVLEGGLDKSQKRPGSEQVETYLEAARAFYAHFSKEPPISAAPEAGVTPFRFISKPKAVYTDNARAAGISGAVRLVVLLGANGQVLHILKLKGIGFGLDEQAIRAAQQIRFEPKKKDGIPVSTVVTIEYTFSVY